MVLFNPGLDRFPFEIAQGGGEIVLYLTVLESTGVKRILLLKLTRAIELSD